MRENEYITRLRTAVLHRLNYLKHSHLKSEKQKHEVSGPLCRSQLQSCIKAKKNFTYKPCSNKLYTNKFLSLLKSNNFCYWIEQLEKFRYIKLEAD